MQVDAEYDLHSFLPNRSCSDKLAETAARIAYLNFDWRYITLVLLNSTLLSGVERFLGLYDKSYIVGKGLFYPHFAQSTQQYVLFGVDIENVAQMLDWMSRHVFDNTGKFIIVCQSEILPDCNETKAFKMFWDYKIINVIFIKSEECHVVGYTLSQPSDDCVYGKPMQLVCPQNNEVSLIYDFPEKFKNLHKCPLIVSTFIQTLYMSISNGIPKGIDGDLVQLIAEGLNATLKMMTPRYGNGWGRLENDGNWSGSLGDLLDDTANFSMTSAAITLARFTHFEMSISYYRSQVVWVMHIAQMKPSSLKLFHPFQAPTEIVIGITFIIVTLSVWIIKSKYLNWNRIFIHSPIYDNNETHDIIFHIWMICMGIPSPKLPTKQIFLNLTLLWIWYCYLIRTLYQVYLINSLQGNFYYEDINTLEDAFNANYSFGGGGALRDYFIDEPILYDNWVVLNTDEIIPTAFEIAKGKKFVLAMNIETTKTLIKENNLLLHILSQRIITSPAVLYYKKFSPLANPINIILRRLVESGFVRKFYKDYVTSFTIKRDDNNRNEPIKLEHYTGCFLILMAGWLLSFLVCVSEICYNKMQDLFMHQYID